MKKVMLMIVAVLMMAVLFVGCNNGDDTSSVPSTASTSSNPGNQTDSGLSSIISTPSSDVSSADSSDMGSAASSDVSSNASGIDSSSMDDASTSSAA